jgi:hypothetical protein
MVQYFQSENGQRGRTSAGLFSATEKDCREMKQSCDKTLAAVRMFVIWKLDGVDNGLEADFP